MMFNISVISELYSHLKLDMACIADLESVRIVIYSQSNGEVYCKACLIAASSALKLVVNTDNAHAFFPPV